MTFPVLHGELCYHVPLGVYLIEFYDKIDEPRRHVGDHYYMEFGDVLIVDYTRKTELLGCTFDVIIHWPKWKQEIEEHEWE